MNLTCFHQEPLKCLFIALISLNQKKTKIILKTFQTARIEDQYLKNLFNIIEKELYWFIKYPIVASRIVKPEHMGAELQNSFKEVAKGPLYCKLTTSQGITY